MPCRTLLHWWSKVVTETPYGWRCRRNWAPSWGQPPCDWWMIPTIPMYAYFRYSTVGGHCIVHATVNQAVTWCVISATPVVGSAFRLKGSPLRSPRTVTPVAAW